mmetsp:Transcript_38717/g.91361  ORF Transcript_38717/g.91361 Transcript_38717/m.91361 type:complete len:316 (-) Transcript_38717:966-1913(-)
MNISFISSPNVTFNGLNKVRLPVYSKRIFLMKKSRENGLVLTKMQKEKNEFESKIPLFTNFLTLMFGFFFLSSINFFEKMYFNPVFSAKFSNKNLFQKLTQVPVFAVTNATGQPYLANNMKGEQVGLIFFSHEDALALLKGMQKTHQVLDARIYIMGLDKAYKMVLSNATPSGIKGTHGQELKMIFRFYPNQKQIKNANSLMKNFKIFSGFKGIPVFIAEGLTIRKGREDVIPMFLTKEDLEKAWSIMCQHNPDQPLKPEIEVGDLLQIVKEMEKNSPEFSKCGFFPPESSIDFVKKENKTNPSAKIFSNSSQKI